MDNNNDLGEQSQRSWVAWLALVPFLAGVAIGLLALGASLGVWFGWWDFRQGFDYLGKANSYAPWVAGACLGLTIVLGVLTKVMHPAALTRAVILGALGTVAAGLAYYVPESYRPPEETPLIHDVSTDTVNPLQYVDILPLRENAPNTTVYGGSPDMTPEKLAQLQTEAYPDLVPLRLSAPRDEVFAKALAVVDAMGWELVSQVPEEGRIEATATTFWFRFKDDVVIKITSEGGETVVNARSLSRVGRGDAGTNANRLREFFARLQE